MNMNNTEVYQKFIERSKQARSFDHQIKTVLKPHELTIGDWTVLNIIHDGQSHSKDIAAAMDTSLAYAVNTTNSLQRLKWVKRSNNKIDRRSQDIVFIGSEDTLKEINKAVESALKAYEETK